MFNERLRELRIRHNLTQRELGDRLNLSAGTIGMYEQGRRMPNIGTLVGIAEFFNVSPEYLIGSNFINPSISSTSTVENNEDRNSLITPESKIAEKFISCIGDIIYHLKSQQKDYLKIIELILDINHGIRKMIVELPTKDFLDKEEDLEKACINYLQKYMSSKGNIDGILDKLVVQCLHTENEGLDTK